MKTAISLLTHFQKFSLALWSDDCSGVKSFKTLQYHFIHLRVHTYILYILDRCNTTHLFCIDEGHIVFPYTFHTFVFASCFMLVTDRNSLIKFDSHYGRSRCCYYYYYFCFTNNLVNYTIQFLP